MQMIIKTVFNLFLFLAMVSSSAAISAKTKEDKLKNTQEVYQLSYIEREPGVDEYEVTMLVSDRYLRIDQAGEDSGFIVYDDKDKIIYSVSHHDESVLVIKEHVFSEKTLPVKYEVEYLQLADAPMVSGNTIFNYRVYTGKSDAEETCLELQLVENLLPDVSKLLKNYQNVVSGQHVKMTDNKVSDVQTACYFIDQIYNTGKYYDKGLPIQEWHSNERFKVLSAYKKIAVSPGKFTIPEKYRQFSVDKNSKTFLE